MAIGRHCKGAGNPQEKCREEQEAEGEA